MSGPHSNSERQLYVDCIEKQIEEIRLLSSIYCAPGELHILDSSYVCEFEQFLRDSNACPSRLSSHLEFTVKLEIPIGTNSKEKLTVRIELPHLYPNLQLPVVTIHSPLLTKEKTQFLKLEMEKYVETLEKQTPCVFQWLTWIQEQMEDILQRGASASLSSSADTLVEFERLWIYSHHIKAKSKRHEIIKQARELCLSGFSRPGKPGIICVEGLRDQTQEFWRIIRSLHWQKITICKSEGKRERRDMLEHLRRFEGFKEQLFTNDGENEDVVMDMALFVKFLEAHNSGYMKKELFGFD